MVNNFVKALGRFILTFFQPPTPKLLDLPGILLFVNFHEIPYKTQDFGGTRFEIGAVV